jgi:hypothetical protein
MGKEGTSSVKECQVDFPLPNQPSQIGLRGQGPWFQHVFSHVFGLKWLELSPV